MKTNTTQRYRRDKEHALLSSLSPNGMPPFALYYLTHTPMYSLCTHVDTHSVKHPCAQPHHARAVPAAICPALVLPVDDPLDAAGSLTIAAIQPIHLLFCPGQLLKPTPKEQKAKKKRRRESALVCVYIHM